jgi:hypothetical protein
MPVMAARVPGRIGREGFRRMMSDSTSALVRSCRGNDAATERRRTRGGIMGGERSEPPRSEGRSSKSIDLGSADGELMDYTVDAA